MKSHTFKLALHPVNGLLRSAPSKGSVKTRETSAKDYACRLGKNHDVMAEVAPGHFQNRGLPSPGAARKHNEFRFVARAMALASVRTCGKGFDHQ